MTSSTSASEWGARAAALLLPVGVLAGFAVGVADVPVPVGGGAAAGQLASIHGGPEVLVVGNSVAASLGMAELGRGRVENVAMEGSFPPHWAALLAMGHAGTRARPDLVVVYATDGDLLATGLVDEEDRARLLLLEPGRVPGLAERALGEAAPPVAEAPWSAHRAAARDEVVQALARGPLDLLWPASRPHVEPALERLMGPVVAQDPAAVGGTPGGPRAMGGAAPPTPVPPAESVLPLLAEVVADLGADLVFVLPAERSTRVCAPLPEAAAWVEGQGGTVLDLRALPLDPAAFTSEHHLSFSGQGAVSQAIAAGLADAAQRRPGCP